MPMPPMPPPWDPYYAQWYNQWYYSYYGMQQSPQTNTSAHPKTPKIEDDQPPPPGFEEGPPPAKKPTLDLGAPPPPPPPADDPQEELKIKPEWQAAKKGAVIYKNPRPPTPEPPKPVVSEPEPSLPPPQLVTPVTLASKPEPKRMQWFYDGESWVYAFDQPPMKPPKPPEERDEFKYSFGGSEDPVGKAFMANMKGKYMKPEKPKAVPVRCDVCSLTVSCQKTYESHIAGKPHKKRAAQTEKIKQLQEKISADTERAMNSVPGGNKPGNPLQSRPNGDIFCTVCDCTMNSGAQAQSHIAGVKHRAKMDRSMRQMRGRGGNARGGRGFGPRGFGPPPLMGPDFRFGRGYGPPGPRFGGPGPPGGRIPSLFQDEEETGGVCDEDEAPEEYERVLAEALADNIDIEEAKSRAEAAKQAALGAMSSFEEAGNVNKHAEAATEADEDSDDYEDDSKFPPPGIVVIKEPKGEEPGTYRCKCCGVMLLSESNLQNHLTTAAHQMFIDEKKKQKRQQKASASSRGRGRGGPKIYRGKCNAFQEGTMKAQRGRRGLISYGEAMPNKLTKSQKKAQPKDIAELLKSKQAGLETAGDDIQNIKKVAPLLMSFVKGEVLEGNQ